MNLRSNIVRRNWHMTTALYSSIVALSTLGLAAPAEAADAHSVKTASPIKHLIVLIGENRGLDHTFGVYTPVGKGETISNLLSKKIVNADGSPGPKFSSVPQYSVAAQPTWYFGAPNMAKTKYTNSSGTNPQPQPNTNGAPTATVSTYPNTNGGGPFTTVADAVATGEADISYEDFNLLTTGATRLPNDALDTRIPGAGNIVGPFMLLGPQISDDDYTGDMTHRFYQAAQQQDCSIANATKANPTGCLNDLFPFVMDTYDRTATTQNNFSEANEMGFYNVAQDEVSLLKQLADRFTLVDNFHQSVLGGTAANHVMFGHADAIFYSDGNGNVATPPSSVIANPNPVSGTINQYTADQAFTNCSDMTRPEIAAIVTYLAALTSPTLPVPYAKPAKPNCASGAYYMVNNVNPGYLPNGALASLAGGALPGTGFVPPSSVKSIGDALSAKSIPWTYYGGSYNDAVALSNYAVANNITLAEAALANPAIALGAAYCQICNPFQYDTSTMADKTTREAHVQDTVDLIGAIQNSTLPSVSIGKPDGLLDGHPQSSKIDLFEAYVQNLLDALETNPKLKAETAVIITWDEAGGYWDSGFIQPVDFFGDSTRIPALILSPYTTGGKVYHGYSDHVSIDKFVEYNWDLKPLTSRSRDNLPNPTPGADPYVPGNMPALDDLVGAFDFSKANNQPYYE
jgi:phospholipase C